MFYRLKRIIIKNVGEVGGGGGWEGCGVLRPRVKNPKSPNGTETKHLTIYKRGLGFSSVIEILIR